MKYKPEHQDPNFCSIRTFMRLPYTKILEDVDFAIVGLPFDTGSGYRIGARFAPETIRSVSLLLGSYNIGIDVSIFEILSGIDYGDIHVVPGYIDDSIIKIEEGLSVIHNMGVIPIGLGGDHSILLAELRAAAKRYGSLGLVLFDSHHDCWNSYQGHSFFNSTSIRRGVEEGLINVSHSIICGLRGAVYSTKSWKYAQELGFEIIPASQIHQIGLQETCCRILSKVGQSPLFLSFDIDFLDPAFAPGTGTPEIGGFSTWEAQELLRGLCGLDVKAADIVEVIPAYDHSQITSIAAANLIFEIISLLAWKKQNSNKS